MMEELLNLTIDGKQIECHRGEKILWVALDNGIYIPNLCALRSQPIPFAGCRLCLVEVTSQGKSKIVTACSEPVRQDMSIVTNSHELLRLRTTGLQLLLSDHEIDCPNCAGVKKCQLLKIAGWLKVKVKHPARFKKTEKNLPIDLSHPEYGYNPNKCVKCGKCLSISQGNLSFINYGLNTEVATFYHLPIKELNDLISQKWWEICPTGAFFTKLGGIDEKEI